MRFGPVVSCAGIELSLSVQRESSGTQIYPLRQSETSRSNNCPRLASWIFWLARLEAHILIHGAGCGVSSRATCVRFSS